MIDSGYEVRVGYIGKLNGLTYKSKIIRSYDEIADQDDNSQFYIVVSGQSSTDDSLKCGFSSLDLITLNIIGKYSLGSGTKKDVELIASDVMALVYPSPGKTGIVTPNLNIWDTRLVMNKTLTDETSDKRIFTKLLTFQHRINHIS